MKDIYVHETKVYIKLKDGNQIFMPQEGRRMYQYGNIPENQNLEINGEENSFNFLTTAMACPNDVTSFRHRKYIYVCIDCMIRSYKRVYKSQIDRILILHRYTKIKKPRMEWLKKDLDFYTYSQLIFDREQELRRMLTE